MTRFKTRFFCALVLATALLARSGASFAGDRFANKTFNISAIGGLPQFLGLELAYLGLSPVVIGLSFGSAPVNGFLNSLIHLTPVSVNFSLPDPYTLYPSSNFSMYSASAFMKIFPWKAGFFFDISFSTATFNANVQANLKNETTGSSISSAVAGSASLNQLVLGLSIGYQVVIASSFFFELGVGGGYLFRPTYIFSLGGKAADLVGVIPNGEQSLANAKAQVQSAFDSSINTYQNTLKITPLAYLNIGFSF